MKVLLLGAAQDGGVPQAGCVCAVCDRARTAPAPSYLVCSLGVIDYHEGLFWLVDATPDLRTQLHLLQSHATGCRLAGILITHAHMGHYTGLIHLGREAMNARNLPLYGTPAFGSFLQSNAPWKQLVETGNVAWRAVQPGQGLQLTPRLNVMPVAVPHRAEYTDTVGYLLRGPSRAMFYCPDIDGWSQWGRDVRAFLAQVDVALVDGTFFDRGELTGRDMGEVPHPLVRQTVLLLEGIGTEVCFVHLNHTNPLWRAGEERTWLEAKGFTIGSAGQSWAL